MQGSRRRFLTLAASAAAFPVALPTAKAQAYPNRPVRLIVGAVAGSPPDIVARIVGRWLSAHLSQSFEIENRPGAGTNLATEAVVRAPADGYTLLHVTSSNAWNASLYENLSFNFIRDIAPVASINRGIGVMVVHPSFPARTVPEFLEYAKANPGKLNMGSGGSGSASHIYGELFKIITGIDMVHVPYRGNPFALTALLAGEVQVIFDSLASAIEYIKTRRLRALGVTSAERSEILPDVPVLGDFAPGYEATGFQGLGAPKGTPETIINQLNAAINSGLHDGVVRAQLDALTSLPLPMTPGEFQLLIADETEKWSKVIRPAHIRAD